MHETIPSQVQKRSVALRNERLKADPTCSKCGETKTVADFPVRDVCYWCNDCRAKYAISLYHKQWKAMSDQERQEFRDKVNRRRREKIARMSDEQRRAFYGKTNSRNMQLRNAAKDAVYKAYGGYKCACCGETEPKFLSVDHVRNDGADHKRKHNLRTGEQMYRWLIRNNFPEGFQILCMNCQWGKRNNHGVCPHLERCNDYSERKYGQAAGSASHP